MNKPQFEVTISSYQQINEIAGGWVIDDYQKLLGQMEFDFGDVDSESELRELCVMCLQEKEIAEAASIVLKHRLGDRLSAGQIQSVAEEISEEKHWEHYADQSLHEGFFHVGNLMFAAFPREMDEPDAVKIEVELTAKNAVAKEVLQKPLHESFVARLLGDGMDDNSILHRLFDEQLKGDPFPEADSIIWIATQNSVSESTAKLDVISSCHWLDALKGVEHFESSATPDDAD